MNFCEGLAALSLSGHRKHDRAEWTGIGAEFGRDHIIAIHGELEVTVEAVDQRRLDAAEEVRLYLDDPAAHCDPERRRRADNDVTQLAQGPGNRLPHGVIWLEIQYSFAEARL